ncbi:hypothetical protein [Desulfobacter vibrioformis]|uniref:hypothetical protein n=1 Tax=Desulfobacter vibrioformis TaxID=34031 RepID=UPI000558EDE5|nr:hypothetical protein [Desulfobacter vibrioformis]
MAQSILSLHLVVERQNVIGGYFESQQTAIPFEFRGNPNRATAMLRNLLHDQAQRQSIKPSKPALSLSPDVGWHDIAIEMAEETASIWCRGKLVAHDVSYKEMGFQDLKRKMPNIRWDYMQKLARNSCLEPQGNDFAGNLKKQVSELRHDLRGFFKISEDPFHPFQIGGFYMPRFKIKIKRHKNEIKGITIENL